MAKLQDELKQSRPFASLAVEVYLNLVRTSELLRGETADLLRERALSAPQYNVLRILRGAGSDGHPCAEIGARMVSRVPDVTRLVDRLEAAGLAERRRSGDDRRVVRVRIKRAGRDLLARIDEPIETLPERQFAALSNAELKTLNNLLTKARAGLATTARGPNEPAR